MNKQTTIDFVAKYEFSRKRANETDIEEFIRGWFYDCASVTLASAAEDKTGIDYWVNLKIGRKIPIDLKTRDIGCRQYWRKRDIPELAVERWSIAPALDGTYPGVIGWTLDSTKATEYILYAFDPADTLDCYLFPFQFLRLAFRKHGQSWLNRFGKRDRENQHGPRRYFEQYNKADGREWTSACLFVPADIITQAVADLMHRVHPLPSLPRKKAV